MRHYFKVRADGSISGVAVTGGGFTDDLDLSDELNQHPYVLSFREFAQQEEDFLKFMRWDCPCPPEDEDCPCAHMNFVDFYYDGVALIEKVPITVTLDGVDQAEPRTTEPLDYPPGTSVTMTIRAAVPDGTTVLVEPRGRASILQSGELLTFTSGETNPVTLKAPAQGTIGRVIGGNKLVRQFSVSIRGWA